MTEPECRFFFVKKPHPDSPDYDEECISWVEGWSEDIDWLMGTQMEKGEFPFKPHFDLETYVSGPAFACKNGLLIWTLRGFQTT